MASVLPLPVQLEVLPEMEHAADSEVEFEEVDAEVEVGD